MATFNKRPLWKNVKSGNVSFSAEEFAAAQVGDEIAIRHAFRNFIVARYKITQEMLDNAQVKNSDNGDTYYLVACRATRNSARSGN